MIPYWKSTVAVAVAGLGLHALNDFRPVDTYFPPPPDATAAQIESHFSDSYYEARALFRSRARDAGVTLHTLPLPHLTHLDLSIDVAVIPGRQDGAFVHMSGTHGVEGFAGSAIQSAILADARNLTSKSGLTVVLVHAVNPYGFSQLRRTNENNVDLNRNWLSPEQFVAAKEADPNANGYADIYDIINPMPSGSPWKMHFVFLKSLVQMAIKGYAFVKKAMVSATYHYSEGIFFGGFEKQPSLQLLEMFLVEKVGIGKLSALTIVDVHTGLGPAGVDTILLTPMCDTPVAEAIFAEENAAGLVASTNAKGNAVTKGYENSGGYVTDGIVGLFPVEHRDKVITVGQEFGTVPFLFVTKALIEENAMYEYYPTRRLPFAEKLRDVFYVHKSAFWKQQIVARGLALFQKLYKHATK